MRGASFAPRAGVANLIRLTFLACLLAACARHEHEAVTHPIPTAMAKRAAIAPPATASIANLGAANAEVFWKVSGDRATKLASGHGLRQPNGVAFHDVPLWIAPFSGKEIYRLDGDARRDIVETPRGPLDGLVSFENGTRIVTIHSL